MGVQALSPNETEVSPVVPSQELPPLNSEGQTPPPPLHPRLRHLSILPNVCTSSNLLCGYLAIIMTAKEEYLVAGWLIVLATVFDILDGRIARLTSVTSRFGAELDSLADLVSFGVAPAFLVFSRYMSENQIVGVICSSVFVICGALRLARFNVTPPSGKDVFEGLPIPAGAGILCTLTIFELQFFAFFIPDAIIPFVVVITSFLMVSKIEYPAMKKSKKTGFQRQILVLGLIGALIVAPPLTLFLCSWGFASYGLFMELFRKVLGLFRLRKNTPQELPVK
jgi:CDP-diacylglycerol--serine O-phosphatidyltransferase